MRPATLTAAVVPVVVGTACALAVGGFRPMPALFALLGALFIQLGTNLANDVFDYEKGADTKERLGPLRVVQAGLLSPTQVRLGMALTYTLAVLAGIYLTWVAGPAIVVIGLASIVSGVLYTAGPYPLGYHGLGDVFVMAFFGFVAVCGTVFVQALFVPTVAWWAAIPVGSIATAILVVNNIRDRETDLQAGKRTLAVRMGRRGASIEYAILMIIAYAVPCILVGLRITSPWALLPIITLPLALRLIYQAGTFSGRSLNRTLEATAKLMLLHGGLFAVGLAQALEA